VRNSIRNVCILVLAAIGLLVAQATPVQAATMHFKLTVYNCSHNSNTTSYYPTGSEIAEAFRLAIKDFANGRNAGVDYDDLDHFDPNLPTVYTLRATPGCNTSTGKVEIGHANIRHAVTGQSYEVDRQRCNGAQSNGLHAYLSNALAAMGQSTITMQQTNAYKQVQVGLHYTDALYGYENNDSFIWRHNTISGGC
jgi:hypothetical protein